MVGLECPKPSRNSEIPVVPMLLQWLALATTCQAQPMKPAEILRIDLELDDELNKAWLTCADRHPALGQKEIVRELLVAEAARGLEAPD